MIIIMFDIANIHYITHHWLAKMALTIHNANPNLNPNANQLCQNSTTFLTLTLILMRFQLICGDLWCLDRPSISAWHVPDK